MRPILGMGNALVDILVTLPDESILSSLGLTKGSMQLVDLAFSERVLDRVKKYDFSIMSGGSASNTIHGLSRLGAECSFVGKISDDEFGNAFENDLIKSSVKPKLFKGSLETGRAVALITPDSERTFATYLGSAVTLSAEEITPELFEGYDYFHVEGYLVQNHALIEKALSTAKKMGLVTSLDLASFNIVTENLGFLQNLVKNYVEIVFANEEEARSFTGLGPEESVNKISEMCRIAVVKTGAKGSIVRCEENVCEVGSFKVNPVDTTGAGDLYASGFIFGLMNGKSLVECARTGSFLASKVIEKIGAKIPESEWASILAEIGRI
jgi:sugar/nucleoside kinase (ribokinase family)